jgi:hypothetical protein
VTDFDGDGSTDSVDACVSTPGANNGCPARAARLPDGDGDGVPNDGRDKCPNAKATTDANFDGCTDATATPTPTPTPTATPTSAPPVVVPPKPPVVVEPPAVEIVNATLSTDRAVYRKYTIFRRLTLKGVPAGAKVTVTCKGKKCPAKRFTSRRKGAIKLKKFTKKKLRAGTKLTIRVTKEGAIGKQFVITIRKGKAPRIKVTQIA